MEVRHATVRRGNAGAMYKALIAGNELMSMSTNSDTLDATNSHDTTAMISNGS